MKKNIFDQYNSADSLLVISAYPKKGQIYSKGVCAVSSFAKNTLLRLKKENPNRKIIVLTIELGKKESYIEDDILVIRCFKRNSVFSFKNLLVQVLRFGKVKDILIEFEFASFGDTLTTSMVAPFVLLLSLLRKNISLVIHQVLFDIGSLSGHIGVKSNNLKLKILNFGLKWFYFLLTLKAKHIVVLEDEFKKRLSSVCNANKITVIPHGVDTNIKKVNGYKVREKLKISKNEFVVLYFGYLTWYKGVDFLIQSLRDVRKINGKKIRLLIAGGPSFTQEKKSHYKRFVAKINKMIKSSPNVISTGFVEEKDITGIFEASDLTVFPYRTFMSSSGPLSLAISHKKPFILSRNLSHITESLDIKRLLKTLNMNKKDLVFDLNKKSLVKTITQATNPKLSQKMLEFSRMLYRERSFENLSRAYKQMLNEKSQKEFVNSYEVSVDNLS
ncbi:MAG: glycosyltransferase [Candidatus Levybacteria bacterium]|nr:glycosyltransferase [Candidatus Levybacteria bacterium]